MSDRSGRRNGPLAFVAELLLNKRTSCRTRARLVVITRTGSMALLVSLAIIGCSDERRRQPSAAVMCKADTDCKLQNAVACYPCSQCEIVPASSPVSACLEDKEESEARYGRCDTPTCAGKVAICEEGRCSFYRPPEPGMACSTDADCRLEAYRPCDAPCGCDAVHNDAPPRRCPEQRRESCFIKPCSGLEPECFRGACRPRLKRQ